VSDQSLLIVTFATYTGLCLVLGVVAWRRTRSLADYLLGGRSLGSWVTAFGAQASDMSGWLLLGLPGLAFAAGIDAAWLALGLVIGTWCNWRFIAARLRDATEQADNALTLPDYLEHRFKDDSRLLRSVSALFILLFFTFYASAGLVAAGRLFESLFDLPYQHALAWGGVVVASYTLIGGFLAVSWSDVLQGSLMFFALILVAAVGVELAGGSTALILRLDALDATLLDPLIGEAGAPLGLIGILSLVAWGLGYPGQPHILARFMAIRDSREIPRARQVAMVWVCIVLAAAMIVGLAGAVALDPALPSAARETVFVELTTRHLPPVLAGICLSGILAAIMSTASAQLLVASSAFAEDLYRGLARPQATASELLWIGRAAVLGISIVAFLIALDPASQVLELVAWAWAGFGAVFGPAIILSLYNHAVTRTGTLVGMLCGGLMVVGWERASGGIFELYALVPGFFAALITTWLVSRVTAPSKNFR
jgi:sodium/proline symporter